MRLGISKGEVEHCAKNGYVPSFFLAATLFRYARGSALSSSTMKGEVPSRNVDKEIKRFSVEIVTVARKASLRAA